MRWRGVRVHVEQRESQERSAWARGRGASYQRLGFIQVREGTRGHVRSAAGPWVRASPEREDLLVKLFL